MTLEQSVFMDINQPHTIRKADYDEVWLEYPPHDHRVRYYLYSDGRVRRVNIEGRVTEFETQIRDLAELFPQSPSSFAVSVGVCYRNPCNAFILFKVGKTLLSYGEEIQEWLNT